MGRNSWGNPLRVHETIMINLNATNLLLIKNNPELCRCYVFKDHLDNGDIKELVPISHQLIQKCYISLIRKNDLIFSSILFRVSLNN